MANTNTASKSWPELVNGVPKGLETGLRNYWYPIIQSPEVPSNAPVGLKCLNEDLVIWRDGEGRAHVMNDRCPHRWVKLSAGRVLAGELQCAYHGLRFAGDGSCTLIPWEKQASDLNSKLCVTSYPTEEIGGYVWAYLGDVKKFPAPPIEDCLPEELLHPDRFIHFSLPTEEWDANWLLVIDGSDTYHAVTLHAESQEHESVLRYIDPAAARAHAGKDPGASTVPLADRLIEIVETDGHGLRGISVDREGRHLDHGHRLEKIRGERFNLPGLVTNVLRPVPTAAAYVSRLYQVPIDYHRTRLFRFAAWRVESDEQREKLRDLVERVVRPRQLRTSAEDRAMAAMAGDLVESRANEFLLGPDRDMVRIRRRLADAFVAQQLEGTRAPRGERTPSRDTLVFPV